MHDQPFPRYPILVVDDEERALAAMRIALRSAGYDNLRLSPGGNGVAAAMRRERFSLVLLDLNMPGLSGHEIVRQTADLADRPPIVVVTASTQIEDYAEAARGGTVEYLVKPVDVARLVEVVHRTLSGPHGPRRGRLTRDYLLSDDIRTGSRPDGAAGAGVVEMLELTRRQYRRLFESLPTPYVLLDPEGLRVRYCNRAFARFLGIDAPQDAVGMHFFELLDPEPASRGRAALEEGGEIREQELSGRTPDGRQFVIVGSFRSSADDGYVEGGFVDVTGPRRLEQQLARTQRLEVVGRMAAGLAHDFNNILLVIAGYADLILCEPDAVGEAPLHARQIQMAVARARGMVKRLLSIGKGSRRERACIDLNDVLRDVEPSLRRHLRDGHVLELRLDAQDALVDISVEQVDEVVRNLVLNARDAIPGAGSIEIATSMTPGLPHEPGRAAVRLDVRDTGTGMDAETRARIFETFFTTKPDGVGTGLGLPMVQQIVEGAGGAIEVESEPGKGSRFRVYLPSASTTGQEGARGAERAS